VDGLEEGQSALVRPGPSLQACQSKSIKSLTMFEVEQVRRPPQSTQSKLTEEAESQGQRGEGSRVATLPLASVRLERKSIRARDHLLLLVRDARMTNLSRTIRSACREEHRERSTSSSLLHHLRSFLVDRLIITSTNTHTKEKKKTRQPAARAVFIQRDPRAALRKGEREWKGEKKGEGRTGLGVLSLDLETPEVSETSVGPDLLESLEVLSHLLVDLVGDDVGVLAVGDVLLPVKEPGGYTNATERGRQREREKSV
jgi:hypothetical protein